MRSFNLFNLAAYVVITTTIISCSSSPKEKANECLNSSYELSLTKRDTVNRIDCNGKQGIWIPSSSNKLQDTTYYRNDTAVG